MVRRPGPHAIAVALIAACAWAGPAPAQDKAAAKADDAKTAPDKAAPEDKSPDAKNEPKAGPDKANPPASDDDDEPPKAPPGSFIDQDDNALPTPVQYSFKSLDNFDAKVGIGTMFMAAQPFGGRTGYSQVFSEGDWSIFGTGFSLHWDAEVRVGLGLFEQRDPTVLPLQTGDLRDNNFYRYPGTYPTYRSTDYMRADKAYASFDWRFLGIDVGRERIPEAAMTIVDGPRLRLDFDIARIGAFAGVKPNPWHQQVVGAASGGAVPEELLLGLNEYFPVGWGQTNKDPVWDCFGQTQGPYANEVGLSLVGACSPWLNAGSYRFQTGGVYGAFRYGPASADGALVADTFFDPTTGFDPATGKLAQGQQVAPGLDRLWLTTQGAVRVFKPLTVAWRGSFDIIGAKPLWLRNLFLDVTYRNLGPFSFSATYFKINTYATALSYGRFFRPLERRDEVAQDIADPAQQAAFLAVPQNNAQLFVVDRDRLAFDGSFNLGQSMQMYGTVMAERRGDFAYTPDVGFGAVGQGYADFFGSLATQVPRCAQLGDLTDGPGALAPQAGEPVGINPQVPVYLDPCKLGGTVGIRDPFLAGVGSFDLHFTHMRGYFSVSSRVAGRVGVSLFERVWADVGLAYERNTSARVFRPALLCDDDNGACGAEENPAPDANTQVYKYLPQELTMMELNTSLMAQVVGPWFIEASYYGFLEDVPFQGDYYYGGTLLPRDTFQLVHTLFFRTLLRF